MLIRYQLRTIIGYFFFIIMKDHELNISNQVIKWWKQIHVIMSSITPWSFSQILTKINHRSRMISKSMTQGRFTFDCWPMTNISSKYVKRYLIWSIENLNDLSKGGGGGGVLFQGLRKLFSWPSKFNFCIIPILPFSNSS